MKTLGKLQWGLPPLLILLAILGATLTNIYLLFSTLALISVSVLLFSFNLFRERLYPYLIYSIGLSLLFHVTLFSPYLIGTDLHAEYYYATHEWNPAFRQTSNSALSVTILAPFLARLLSIDVLWVFKAVYPTLFAFVPLILYLIFSQQFEKRVAFLSAFFFMSVPTFFLELTGIAKQQIGELFLVLVLFLILDRKLKWRWRVKVPIVIILSFLVVLSHYSMTPILLLYLGLGFAFLVGFRLIKIKGNFPLRYLGLITAILLLAGLGYYGWVASGKALEHMTSLANLFLSSIHIPRTPEVLVHAALGLDFLEVSLAGKAFRVLQYLTQLLIVLGSIYLFFTFVFRRLKSKVSPEFMAFLGVAIFLLMATLFLPGFSRILNSTRFYHLSLLLLAPTLVIGCQVLLGRYRRAYLPILTIVLLIPYFCFTSGAVFELTKSKAIDRIDTPYSVVLSGYRLDLGASFTKNDEEVRAWLMESEIEKVWTDLYGIMFMGEEWGPGVGLHRLPPNLCRLPEGSYIYLREWNEENEMLTFWKDIGLRVILSYDEVKKGCTSLREMEVIYESGKAKIVRTP